MENKRPYLSSFKDRHGNTRWRFRRDGKTISLLGQPGETQFEIAYEQALNGLAKPKRNAVVAHPNASAPCSLGAAWKIDQIRRVESIRPSHTEEKRISG